MLDAQYQPREGRTPAGRTQAVVGTGSRRLRLAGTDDAGGDSDELLDLSRRGMKVRTGARPPAPGSRLGVELRHPEVRGAVSLEGEVRWVEGDRFGVTFVQVRDTTAVALERLLDLERADEGKDQTP